MILIIDFVKENLSSLQINDMGIPITALVCSNTAITREKELSRSIGIPIDLLSFKVITSITDFKACFRSEN